MRGKGQGSGSKVSDMGGGSEVQCSQSKKIDKLWGDVMQL